MKKNLLAFLTFLLILTGNLYSQTDGTLDPTFDPGIGPNAPIGNMVIQKDGKILICLGFSKYNNISRPEIARVNTDGTLDTTFKPGGGGIFGNIRSMAIQPDNKIIIGGSYTNYDNHFTGGINRIHPNGSFDPSLNTGNGISGEVIVVALQADGKILIGGAFNGYNGKIQKNLVRILPNGRYDSSFVTGTSPNAGTSTSSVGAIQVQSDGKIIIAGAFLDFNGTARKRIARLNSDGSLDTTFKPLGGPSSDIACAVLQPDGKIMITGYFNGYNGFPRSRIARLNNDGSLDTSFNPKITAAYAYGYPCLQPDGKIIVSGDNNLIRFNINGSQDTSFNHGLNPVTKGVGVSAFQADGKLVISGQFKTYNGITRNYLARLTTASNVGIKDYRINEKVYNIYPNPSNGIFTLKSQGMQFKNESIEIVNVTDQIIYSSLVMTGNNEINLSSHPKGIYFYQIKDENRVLKKGKIIVE